jgi:hypothetical protein
MRSGDAIRKITALSCENRNADTFWIAAQQDEPGRIVEVDEMADQVDALDLPGLHDLAFKPGDQFIPAAGVEPMLAAVR